MSTVQEAATRPRARFHTLAVHAVERMCEDAVAVTFAVPPHLADAYAFRAGQSLTLRRSVDGGEERRSYSICAPAGGPLRIGVREVPGGLFSSWLVREVRPGDRVDVGTPTGAFTPDLATPGHHVLVAAGSGITPLLSIAATLLDVPGATVTLLYGNRRAGTVMFAEELADLKDRHPARLSLVHVFSREPRDAELLTGRLDAAKLRDLLTLVPDPTTVAGWWLCGPYGVVTAARDLLAETEVPAERVHRELFHVGDLPPEPVRHPDPPVEGGASEVTVTLDGRTSTVPVPGGTLILDGLRRWRRDIPFACKGGVCGTCRARLTNGKVDMRRNFALEEPELAAGYILTCQSVPRTERVTVDFDE